MSNDKPNVSQDRVIEFNQTSRKIAHNVSKDCSAGHNKAGDHSPGCNKLTNAIGVALLAAYLRGQNDTGRNG